MSDIEVKPHISIKLSGGRTLLLSFEEVVELKDKLHDVEQMAQQAFNSNQFIHAYGKTPQPIHTTSIDTNTVGSIQYDQSAGDWYIQSSTGPQTISIPDPKEEDK